MFLSCPSTPWVSELSCSGRPPLTRVRKQNQNCRSRRFICGGRLNTSVEEHNDRSAQHTPDFDTQRTGSEMQGRRLSPWHTIERACPAPWFIDSTTRFDLQRRLSRDVIPCKVLLYTFYYLSTISHRGSRQHAVGGAEFRVHEGVHLTVRRVVESRKGVFPWAPAHSLIWLRLGNTAPSRLESPGSVTGKYGYSQSQRWPFSLRSSCHPAFNRSFIRWYVI